jgi:septation ring formation regulator EzrA
MQCESESDPTFTEQVNEVCQLQNDKIDELYDKKEELEIEINAIRNALNIGGDNFQKISKENTHLKNQLEKVYQKRSIDDERKKKLVPFQKMLNNDRQCVSKKRKEILKQKYDKVYNEALMQFHT